MEKISVIIVHFGKLSTTKSCLDSIIKNKLRYNRLIVVNNSDEKIDRRLSKYPKLNIINNKENLGFAKAVNQGISRALKLKSDYVFLINNDAVVEHIDFEILKQNLEDKNIGIVGTAIKFTRENKSLYDLGGKLNKFLGRTSHIEKSFRPVAVNTVDYVSGCSMFIKKEVFTKNGLLDDRYFLYYEDVDFCMNAKKKGFITIVNTSQQVSHSLSKSTKNKKEFAIFHQTRSGILFGRKNMQYLIPINFLFILVQSIYFWVLKPSWGRAAFSGIINGFSFKIN